jgi:photosystem II stability/assembly factor-like uncharacterized protein
MKRTLILIFLFLIFYISESQMYYWNKVFDCNNISSFCNGIQNIDSNNIIAVFSPHLAGRLVVKSTDAGKNWSSILADTNTIGHYGRIFYATDLSCPTKDFILISCSENKFIKSTDGGKTWQEKEIISLNYEKLIFKADMLTENIGIMSKQYKIFHTTDGFNTLDTIEPAFRYSICSIRMLDTNTICAAAIHLQETGITDTLVKFIKSTDLGKTWSIIALKGIEYPADMKFIDSSTGYLVGDKRINIGDQRRNLVFKTSNGGLSWKKVLDDIPYNTFGLQRLDILDKETIIAVGQFGRIYWTTNSGASWYNNIPDIFKVEYPATMNVCILDKNTALIGEYFGRIYKSFLSTEIKVDQYEGDLKVFPNPAKDYINIIYKSENQDNQSIDLVILDNLGQELDIQKDQEIDSIEKINYHLNISNLAPGVYFIKIGDRFEKFVKM